MDDLEEVENFWDVVGSEKFDSDREEFVARIRQCEENDFVYDEEKATISFNSACPNLVVHYPELYTEVFCRKCGVCVEIKNIKATETEANTVEDDMDEFLSIAGTQQPFNEWENVEECAEDPACSSDYSKTEY